MGIREDLHSVMRLQRDYSAELTDAMKVRGLTIRTSIPAYMGQIADDLCTQSRIPPAELLIEGGDGIGRKAQVPWVRFASRTRSPRATVGWYVVWLFEENGEGAYLALVHASTNNIAGEFVERSQQETRRLVGWAREVVAGDIANDPRLLSDISLGSGKLAKAYERTTASAYYYPRHLLPSDEQLLEDMTKMARLLGHLYSGEHSQKYTKETSLEVIAAVMAVNEITSGRAQCGQSFGLTQAQRKAVELRAMQAAVEHFTSEGFDVVDTSATEPFDLKVRRGEDTLYVEVKGTTGDLGDIVLTKNEVEHHLNNHPKNSLFVLYRIALNKTLPMPVATGGKIHLVSPWMINSNLLQPIAYRYRLK
jgi:predicted subunit of tRNA(5-methylaminomethyl-2-thiouridylate) methyltransferase